MRIGKVGRSGRTDVLSAYRFLAVHGQSVREENIGRLVEQWTGTMEGMGIEQDERDRNF